MPSAPDLTTVDLSLFQVWAGMAHAFPPAFAAPASATPRWPRSPPRSPSAPNIARYLASERRIPFNEFGVFRRYPELDQGRRRWRNEGLAVKI